MVASIPSNCSNDLIFKPFITEIVESIMKQSLKRNLD